MNPLLAHETAFYMEFVYPYINAILHADYPDTIDALDLMSPYPPENSLLPAIALTQ